VKYADTFIQWAILWLMSRYGDVITAKNNLLVRERAISTLWTYMKETSCHECGERAAFGEPCHTCPTMRPENLILGNPVRQYRSKVAKEVYEYFYRRDVENGSYADEVVIVNHFVREKPAYEGMPQVHAVRQRPVELQTVRLRRQEGFQRLLSKIDQVKHHGPGLHRDHERYTHCAAWVLNVIMLLMAQDPALSPRDMLRVMNLLSAMLLHPQDTRFATVHRPSVLAFQEVMLAYFNSIPDLVVSLQENCALFCLELQVIEMSHLMAISDSFPGEAVIMNARLHHYGTVVSPEDPGVESCNCPICQEGYGDSQEEILRFNSCRHDYHTQCFLDNIMKSAVNRNVCGLCRNTIEGLDRVEKDCPWIYRIDWASAAVKELGRPAIATLDMDAASWPRISDVLSSPLV
jgi:hypothetical protein